MKKMIMATAASLLMVGCGDSAPKCDDDNVKNLLIDIYKAPQIKTMNNYIEYCKKNLADKDTSPEMRKVFKESITNREVGIKELSSMDIRAVRTESADDKAQKSTCKAELIVTTKGHHYTWDISYTAQNTSDGELFVESQKGGLYWLNPKSYIPVK